MMPVSTSSFWTVDSDDEWKLVEGRIRRKLDPGIYSLQVRKVYPNGIEFGLQPMNVQSDTLLTIPGSLSEYIVDAVEQFWQSRARYEDMGLIHKRGLLMTGAPGTGKTAICLLVGQEIAKKGGVSVFTAPSTWIGPLPKVLQGIREVQPKLPILNIMEDVDKHRSDIDVLLPMLDGEMQVSNIVHLATTNFIEKLDGRLTNRPSRFDEVIKVKPPGKRARRSYIMSLFSKNTEPIEEELITKMVSLSNGLTFAHLKDLVVCSYVFGRDITKTASRLRALAENSKAAGFGGDEKDDDDDD